MKTLPAVREAMEQHDWNEAREQIGLTAAALDDFAAELEGVAALLE